MAKQVTEQLAGALIGQKLILAQIDSDSFQMGSILHRLLNPFREESLVKVAIIRTKFLLGPMLGYLYSDGW